MTVLRHILAEVEYLLDQSRTLTYERFVADQTLRRAFVRGVVGAQVTVLASNTVTQSYGITLQQGEEASCIRAVIA